MILYGTRCLVNSFHPGGGGGYISMELLKGDTSICHSISVNRLNRFFVFFQHTKRNVSVFALLV